MEWNFTVGGLGDDLISKWDGSRLKSLPPEERAHLRQVIDMCGERSAIAQGLPKAITDIGRIMCTDHVVYLAATASHDSTMVHGMLKVGRKKLFIRVDSGALQEIDPLCVLDFYVHETCQRSGLGHELMRFLLQDTCEAPYTLGYDRPSSKLLSFLKKHYGLSDYTHQNNNFVVFKQYFIKQEGSASLASGGAIQQVPLQMTSATERGLYPECQAWWRVSSRAGGLAARHCGTEGQIADANGGLPANLCASKPAVGSLLVPPRHGRRGASYSAIHQTPETRAIHLPDKTNAGGVHHSAPQDSLQIWHLKWQDANNVLTNSSRNSSTKRYGQASTAQEAPCDSPARKLALKHRAGLGARNALAW